MEAIDLVKCRFNYLSYINWAWSMNEWWSCMPLNFTIETLLTVSISVRFDHCSTHTLHTWLSASQPLYHYDNSVRLLCLSISGYFCSALSWHSWRVLFSLLLFPVFCCFQYFLAKPKSQTKKSRKKYFGMSWTMIHKIACSFGIWHWLMSESNLECN